MARNCKPATTPGARFDEQWLRRLQGFHRARHPREMGSPEVNAFLTDLAVDLEVCPSTQNQALCALLFDRCEHYQALPPSSYKIDHHDQASLSMFVYCCEHVVIETVNTISGWGAQLRSCGLHSFCSHITQRRTVVHGKKVQMLAVVCGTTP